jgi:uncharacterized protein (DUF1800 family)
MIEKLDLGKDDILAFKVDEKVEMEDVKEVLANLQSNLETPSHFKGYVEVHNLKGIEPKALWERMKFGLSNFSELSKKVDKLALVTDKDGLKKFADTIYSVMPGINFQSFAFEDSDKAKEWLSEA